MSECGKTSVEDDLEEKSSRIRALSDTTFDESGSTSVAKRYAKHSINIGEAYLKLTGTPAFVFDIDGVFKNGAVYAPFAADTLATLQENNIPYVFITNGGGGRTEAEYAAEMNKKIELFSDKKGKNMKPHKRAYVTADQLVLSYSPFREHLKHLLDEQVLVVGCSRAIHAAKSYGFTKAIAIDEYTSKHSSMNPFGRKGCEKDQGVLKDTENWDEDIKAVLVFTDPSDFFEALQVITDVLLSSKPGIVEFEKNRRIPCVFSNPDLLWKTQYPHSRFGQGAFRLSLEACYRARMETLGLSQGEIKERLSDFHQFGKPHPIQFEYAKTAVERLALSMGRRVNAFYMVGDNPPSDIRGAYYMDKIALKKKQPRWFSYLVKTGVYHDGEDQMGANNTVENVVEAVAEVMNKYQGSDHSGMVRQKQSCEGKM